MTRKSVSNAILASGVVAGAVLCYLLAAPFIAAIVGAFTLAVLFAPLDTLLRRRLRAPALSAAVTVVAVALIVVVPLLGLVGLLVDEASRSGAIIRSLSDSDTWTRAIEARPRLQPLVRVLTERLDIPELVKSGTSWLAGWSGAFVQGSLASAVSLMLMFYFFFYLLRDRGEIEASVEKMLPLSRAEFALLSRRVVDTISATVLGMATVAALQGVLGGLMFWWLGLPVPLLWGILMGLLAVVPFLGAFVIWAPAALILAIAGEYSSAVILALWGTIVVGLVDNVLYPVAIMHFTNTRHELGRRA